MKSRNQGHDPPKMDDRIRPGKFVDISYNVEIPTTNLSVGKIISDKPIKMNIVHNVLHHAWGRYAGVRVQEIT